MANAILNFHFDYLHTSLSINKEITQVPPRHLAEFLLPADLQVTTFKTVKKNLVEIKWIKNKMSYKNVDLKFAKWFTTRSFSACAWPFGDRHPGDIPWENRVGGLRNMMIMIKMAIIWRRPMRHNGYIGNLTHCRFLAPIIYAFINKAMQTRLL